MSIQPAVAFDAVRVTLEAGRDQFELLVDAIAIEAGDRVAVLGASGSGKSTFLGLIAGLIVPGAGTVRTFGVQASAASARRLGVTYAFQHAVLFDGRTGEYNVRLPERLIAFPDSAVAIRRLMGMFHLDERILRSDVAALSGGERRRVALARDLCWPWRLALLDEPFNDLDVDGRRALVSYLRACDAAQTIITVTHSLTEAEVAGCARVLFLKKIGGSSRVVFDGSIPDFVKTADGAEYRRLVG